MRQQSTRLPRVDDRSEDRRSEGGRPDSEVVLEETTASTDVAARQSLDRFSQVLAEWKRKHSEAETTE